MWHQFLTSWDFYVENQECGVLNIYLSDLELFFFSETQIILKKNSILEKTGNVSFFLPHNVFASLFITHYKGLVGKL